MMNLQFLGTARYTVCRLFFIITVFGSVFSIYAVDSTFIADRSGEISIKFGVRSSTLTLSCDDNDTDLVPNTPQQLIVSAAWKGISLEGSVPLPADTDRGTTRFFDIQLHKYAESFVADCYFQHYRGFYRDEDTVSELFPDMDVLHVGASAQYVVNGEKFSYQAAFSHTQQQLQSAGSLLVGGGIHWTRISSDSIALVDSCLEVTDWQGGIDIGYAYNWVPAPSWLIHASGSLGLYAGSRSLDGSFRSGVVFEPEALIRIAVNRSCRNWSGGIAWLANVLTVSGSENDISVTTVRAELYVVRHLHR